MLYLDASTVADLCRTIDPLEVVTSAFLAVRSGDAAVSPEASLRWTSPDGTAARSLALPARHGDAYGLKVINACIGNISRGLPRAHGLVVLFDPRTAAPSCLLEGGRISALRTAAVSLVALNAVRDLAGIRAVAFLGCGRQAMTHAELLAARAPLTDVYLFDLDAERSAAFAADLAPRWPGTRIEVVPRAQDAVRQATVTFAATTTTTPYVELSWLPAGAVFVNVSLDDATDELLLGCDHLFVDDWMLVSEDDSRLLGRLVRAGRCRGPGEAPPPGGRRVDAELPTLLAGEYPRVVSPSDRVVVNPFGMGIHDIALAAQVYAAARQRSLGLSLP
jgi:ornithine cyclodeaminase/alanine dehydrogenase-like protein (mu-crystallin family)